MSKIEARITVPDDVTFADLSLSRALDGSVAFAWAPLDRICAASRIDPDLIRGSSDNTSALIVGWYLEHRARGGPTDAIAEELIEEVLAEDAVGLGQSHSPGHA